MPAYQCSTPYGAHFLSESPCFMGALSRLQKQVREVLSPYDLMIVLGADPLRMSVYSEVDPMPEGMAIVQVGLVDWDLAKNYGAEIALKADVKETLRALMSALKAAGGAALETRAKKGIAASRREELDGAAQPLVEQIAKSGDQSPIDPDYLSLQVVEAMPDNAILVDEGLTSGRQMPRCARIATATAIMRWLPAASAGACRLPSASASPIPTGRWCASPATAARCIRSSRCGPRRITSCR